MKKKTNEALNVTTKQLADPTIQKTLKTTLKDVPVNITDKAAKTDSMKDTNITSMAMQLEEGNPEAIIQPQDKETIKYLSNVVDPNTGEISKPFNIDGKNYQMVRGVTPTKEIVIAVLCHDETDNHGEKLIHPVDEFEKNIAIPMLQKEKEMASSMVEELSNKAKETYEGHKHFLVHRETNEVRKFKTTRDLVSAGKIDEEDYMGLKEFRQHMNEKMFGKTKRINELDPAAPVAAPAAPAVADDENDDVKMNQKAKKLMVLISKRIPENVITTIKTPVAKREVIAAFAELIGVPRNQLTKLITGLKDLSKAGVTAPATAATAAPAAATTPLTEKRIITKQELTEFLQERKVIKTFKIKDIK